MFVGILQEPLQFNALDIALGRYRIKGASNGGRQKGRVNGECEANQDTACYNMKEAIDFSVKHDIKPHMTAFKLKEVPKMVEMMNEHKAQGRMGVVFE